MGFSWNQISMSSLCVNSFNNNWPSYSLCSSIPVGQQRNWSKQINFIFWLSLHRSFSVVFSNLINLRGKAFKRLSFGSVLCCWFWRSMGIPHDVHNSSLPRNGLILWPTILQWVWISWKHKKCILTILGVPPYILVAIYFIVYYWCTQFIWCCCKEICISYKCCNSNTYPNIYHLDL